MAAFRKGKTFKLSKEGHEIPESEGEAPIERSEFKHANVAGASRELGVLDVQAGFIISKCPSPLATKPI